MARLKTLKDGENEAPITDAGAEPLAGEPAQDTAPQGEIAAEEIAATEGAGGPAAEAVTDAAEGVSTSLDTNGAEGEAPAPPADDPLIALAGEVDAAKAALDKAQAEYLDQSDNLAAANAQVISLTEDVKDRDAQIDALTATLAQRDAQIAALGAAPPAPVAEAAIKRPKVGKALKLPEEDKFAAWADVSAALDDGALVVLALADDGGVVQAFAPVIGGKALFTVQAGALLYAGMIALEPDMEAVTLRFAVLLDADGKVLSVCRLGAVLMGGGGLSAMIPGNNLRFAFT